MTELDRAGSPMSAAAAVSRTAIVVLEGEDLRVTAANLSARVLFDGRQLTGETWSSLTAAGNAAALNLATRCAAERAAQPAAVLTWTSDGEWPLVRLVVTADPWLESGQLRGVVVSLQDQVDSLPEPAQFGGRGMVGEFKAVAHSAGVPMPGSMTVALASVASRDDRLAGGKIADSFTLPDGKVALLALDAALRGPAAELLARDVLSLIRRSLVEGAKLAEAATTLRRFAARHLDIVECGCTVAVIDPGAQRLEFISLGHPPPVLLTRVAGSFTAQFLSSPIHPSLGLTDPGTTLRSHSVTLSTDDLVVLFSESLVHRIGSATRRRTQEFGRVLAQVADAPTSDRQGVVDAVCEVALTRFAGRHRDEQDAVVVAAQLLEPVASLSLSALPALPQSVALARHSLDAWLEHLGARGLQRDGLLYAVGELVTNAVEHAHSERAGQLDVEASLDDQGTVTVKVADHGRWVTTGRSPGRGNGLAVVAGMVDALELRRESTGTVAVARQLLLHPSRVKTTSPQDSEHARAETVQLSMHEKERNGTPTLVVSGALRYDDADELRRQLGRLTQGGSRFATVDLSAATYVSSAALTVLRSGQLTGCLRVLANAGTTAAESLSARALDYVSSPA